MEDTPEREIRGGSVTPEGKEEARREELLQTQKTEETSKGQLTIQGLGPAGKVMVNRDDPCTAHAI